LLVQSSRLQLAFLDPQLLREFRFVASNLLDEELGVLSANVDLERVAERERGSATASTAIAGWPPCVVAS